MKIMVASDIHGSIKHLDLLYNAFLKEEPNQVIFLGDMFSYDNMDLLVEKLRMFYPTVFIRGNCDVYNLVSDSQLDFVSDYTFEAFHKKIFCSHGHIYDSNVYPDADFDVMIGGHTHIGKIDFKDNKYFLNPGSLSLPKGQSVNSYMILDDEGIFLKDLNGTVIQSLQWK